MFIAAKDILYYYSDGDDAELIKTSAWRPFVEEEEEEEGWGTITRNTSLSLPPSQEQCVCALWNAYLWTEWRAMMGAIHYDTSLCVLRVGGGCKRSEIALGKSAQLIKGWVNDCPTFAVQ